VPTIVVYRAFSAQNLQELFVLSYRFSSPNLQLRKGAFSVLMSHGTDELANVTHRIQEKLRGRVRDFQIETDARGLILHGVTRSYHEKQLAQHAVLSVTARPIAANEIIVDPS
jgi:hypothetical protein